MMRKVSVLGHFAEGENLLNGQTVKTKTVTQALQQQLGQDQVLTYDTHGGWKVLLKAPFQVLQALNSGENVFMFPAHNGLRVYGPLLCLLRSCFKNRKIHYAVIGGWLPQFLQNRPGLCRALKRFDGIYVETNVMKKALQAQGFTNVLVVPNCKKLAILSQDQLVYSPNMPYKLCTFSRVMQQKGIEDALQAVKAVNKKMGKTVYTLDIYGPVDPNEAAWFEALQQNFPSDIRYGGAVAFDRSVEVLKDYFALLFPTRFYTEGIPGTIIDAYAAGVPVISARWESFADVVDDGKTGYGYDFENTDQLQQLLLEMAQQPERIHQLKENCLHKAQDYTLDRALEILQKQMEG